MPELTLDAVSNMRATLLAGFTTVRDGKPATATTFSAAGLEARKAIRFNIKYGDDVIKTCATGGVLSLTDDDTPHSHRAPCRKS